MKYSEGFNRDFNWYLKYRHQFNFDGRLDRDIIYSKAGIDGKACFHKFDSEGKLVPTKHPNIVKALLKTKGSINLHIKMWKEDRDNGCLPRITFEEEQIKKYNLLDWMIKAVNINADKTIDRLKLYYNENYISIHSISTNGNTSNISHIHIHI